MSEYQIGDGVCALLAGGGYAEQVVVAAGQVLPIPSGLSFVEAAALPEVFATAYLNLYMEGELLDGERVILHAGASGVGTAAIQMLKTFQQPQLRYCGFKRQTCTMLSFGCQRRLCSSRWFFFGESSRMGRAQWCGCES